VAGVAGRRDSRTGGATRGAWSRGWRGAERATAGGVRLGFRIYGVAPDDMRGWVDYRLQFAHVPSTEALRRIALAVKYARGGWYGDGPWRWSGRFAWVTWNTEGRHDLNVGTCEAIHQAFPLREVVNLSATTASYHSGYVDAESASVAAQPVPDAGPPLAQAEWARYRVPQVAGRGFAPIEAFDRALAERLPPGTRTRPWDASLREALSAGAVELRRVDREAAPGTEVEAELEAMTEVAGVRAGLRWTDDALAILVDGEAFPVEWPRPRADDAPIATACVNGAGTRAAFLTTRGEAIWEVDLDATTVRPAAWRPAAAAFSAVAWLDDDVLVAAAGEALVALALGGDEELDGRRCGRIAARVALDAPIAALEIIGERFIGAATAKGYHVLGLRGAFAPIAAVPCGARGRGEMDADGVIAIVGARGRFEVRRVEPAVYRASLRGPPAYDASGEVAFAPGEPETREDGGVRWYHAGGRGAIEARRAGSGDGDGDAWVVASRATGEAIVPGPRGRELRVWHEGAEQCFVHDGAMTWSIDLEDAYATELAPGTHVEGAGLAYVGQGLCAVIAGDGVLRLRPYSTPPPGTSAAWTSAAWSIACDPLDRFAVVGELAAVGVVGGPLVVLALGVDGPRIAGRWPRGLPAPDAVWAADALCARVGARYFRIAARFGGEPIAALTAEACASARELVIAAFADREAERAAAEAAALAAQELADRPVPMTARSVRGVIDLVPVDDVAPMPSRRPRDGALDLARAEGGAIARNVYERGRLVDVRVGTDAGALVSLPRPDAGRGALAVHPTLPLALVDVHGELWIVDVERAAVRARLPLVGDAGAVTSATFAGTAHVLVTMGLGGVALLRDTGDDLIEVSRSRTFFTHVALPALRDGRVVITMGWLNDCLELRAFAIDGEGDRLVVVDDVKTDGRHARAMVAGERVLVDVPAGHRRQAGTFALTGLERVVAPPSGLATDRLALHRLAGGPPHPNPPSLMRLLPVGAPAPSADPDRWAIRTAPGLGFGVARPGRGAPYRAYAIAKGRAWPVEPVLAGESMRYGVHASGARLLVQVRGERVVHEVDLATARARVVVEGMPAHGAVYAPDGLLVRGVDDVGFHAWPVDATIDATRAPAWRAACSAGVVLQTVHESRVLLAHDPARGALHVYALAPRGPIALGAATTPLLVAWEAGGLVHFLDQYDQRELSRFALTGLASAAAAAAASAAPPVTLLCDPDELLHLPRLDDPAR
jgi:hypothetical protein